VSLNGILAPLERGFAKIPLFNKLAFDKQLHAIGAVVVWIAVYLLTRGNGAAVPLAAMASCFFSIGLLVWKEFFYDAANPMRHTVDIHDVTAGAVPVVVLSLLATWLS